jgi:hypothetical protein
MRRHDPRRVLLAQVIGHAAYVVNRNVKDGPKELVEMIGDDTALLVEAAAHWRGRVAVLGSTAESYATVIGQAATLFTNK